MSGNTGFLGVLGARTGLEIRRPLLSWGRSPARSNQLTCKMLFRYEGESVADSRILRHYVREGHSSTMRKEFNPGFWAQFVTSYEPIYMWGK
jgi:hypothetical protein